MSFDIEDYRNDDIEYDIEGRPLPLATRKRVVLADRIAGTNKQKQANDSRFSRRRPKATSQGGPRRSTR